MSYRPFVDIRHDARRGERVWFELDFPVGSSKILTDSWVPVLGKRGLLGQVCRSRPSALLGLLVALGSSIAVNAAGAAPALAADPQTVRSFIGQGYDGISPADPN